MKPIDFPEANVVFAKDQPPYLPLPSRVETQLPTMPATSCWRLDLFERLRVLLTGRIYVTQMTFGKPLQPISLSGSLVDFYAR